MIFFENFKENFEKTLIKEKEIYEYGMNLRKKVVWTTSGIVMLMIALYGLYYFIQKPSLFIFIFCMVLFLFGGTFIWTMFEYKIVFNKKDDCLIMKKVEIKLSDIEKTTLRLMVPPGQKYLQLCLDIITKEKVQIILPLIMNKKAEFAKLIKLRLKEQFFVE